MVPNFLSFVGSEFSVCHLLSEHIPITEMLGTEREEQVKKRKTDGVVSSVDASSLKLRTYLRTMMNVKVLKQKLDDVIRNSVNLYQVTWEVFAQPT